MYWTPFLNSLVAKDYLVKGSLLKSTVDSVKVEVTHFVHIARAHWESFPASVRRLPDSE